MAAVRVHNFSISLDGFGTGQGLTFDEPFGHAGERLHQWMFATSFWDEQAGGRGVDDAIARRHEHRIGAEIMGRGKFGPQTGPWTDDEWRGWWGDDPPFHTPVFVVTHHPRASIEMEGGTTFHFVEGEPADIVATAKEAAGGLDVRLGGGAATIREFVAADVVDHLHLVVAPIVLGRGSRLWDGLEALEERFAIESVSTPSGVTHLTLTRRTPTAS